MTDKRDLLLTLVFLKFIGERFKRQKEKIRHDIMEGQGIHDTDYIERQLSNPNQYMQEGVFLLTDETCWDKLILTLPTGMAIAFDTAIKTLDDNEPKLKNALPQQIFTKTALEPGVLKSVVDEINKIDPRKFDDHDLIGRVYEYFLQAFSINADKEEGEFYTPHSVVELIASLIEPFDGTVYDPCYGSGGMFVQAAKFIEAHGGNTKAVNVYGQESEPATYRLAKMNLAIRGISYHLGDRAVSTFSDDQHKELKFDYIMANPPFNLKKYAAYGGFETDPRWQGYGVPPASNANYAWILHILNKLNVSRGIAGFLLANGALDDSDTLSFAKEVDEMKMPFTKFQILCKLVAKAIKAYSRTNKIQAEHFQKMLEDTIDAYNTRDKLTFTNKVTQNVVNDVCDIVSCKINGLSNKLMNILKELKADSGKFKVLGITFEEKAFFDVLVEVRDKHNFEYADERCMELAKKIKTLIDDTAIYTDWLNNDNLKSKLASQLTYLLYKEGYPPEWDEEVFQKVLEQVENYEMTGDSCISQVENRTNA